MSANIPANWWVKYKAFLKRKNELWRYANRAVTNLITLDKRLSESQDEEFTGEIIETLDITRDALGDSIADSSGFGGYFKEVGMHINTSYDPETDFDDFWEDLIDDMKTAAVVTVRSRGFTRGVPGYVGTGDGGIIRRSTDRNAVAIEEGIPTTVRMECYQDVSTGTTEGDEVFRIKTLGDIPKDACNAPTAFKYSDEKIAALHALSSANLLANADFSTYDATATPKFSSWSSNDWTMISQSTTRYYRLSQGTRGAGTDTTEAGDGYSATLLPFAGGNRAKIYQRFEEGIPGDKNTPVTFMIFHYGEALADGNIKMSIGSQSSTVAVAIGAWTVQTLQYFPEEFDASPLDVVIERLADTASNVAVSNVILAPMTKYNGEWYAIYAGLTNFVLADQWNQTITVVANEGRLQYETWKRTGKYFNHSVAPTIEDWYKTTGTVTFNAGPSVLVDGSADCKFLTELRLGDWIFNLDDDDVTDAVQIVAPLGTDIQFTISGVYGGTLGAGKQLGVYRPW